MRSFCATTVSSWLPFLVDEHTRCLFLNHGTLAHQTVATVYGVQYRASAAVKRFHHVRHITSQKSRNLKQNSRDFRCADLASKKKTKAKKRGSCEGRCWSIRRKRRESSTSKSGVPMDGLLSRLSAQLLKAYRLWKLYRTVVFPPMVIISALRNSNFRKTLNPPA